MLSSLAAVAPAFHGGVAFLLPLFIIGHVFGFLLFILLIAFLIGGRRRRMARWAGYGHFGPGGFGPGQFGRWGHASSAAETTLAERFAQGDIDEKEYRARLEVLRANNANNAGPQAGGK